MVAWRSGVVEVTGGRLVFHRTGGGGPPLVLSHGLTDNGLCWSRLAAALAPEFDIVMLDARGHGESSRMPKGDAHDPARDIAEAIEGLGLISPIVMGHSVGARATAAYANAHADRVSKVVLEDPPFLPLIDAAAAARRREGFGRRVGEFRAMSEAEIIAMGKASSPNWHDDDFPAWAAAKRQVDPDAMPTYREPWQDTIARITAPTLLVHGDPALGGLVTPDIAAEVVAINPNIKAVRISGAGHNTRRENFADYLAAVRGFLRAP
jgi:pimeloyl-ACP methyl ester carboxylesterase